VSVLLYGDNKEIVSAIEAIASEKGIKKEVFFDALEAAFLQIAKNTFGERYNFIVRFGRSNGLVEFARELTVVEKVENEFCEISLKNAQKVKSDAKIGETIAEDMPTIEINHDILYRVRKEISEVILEAEKDIEYQYFQNLYGQIVTGTIKRVSPNGVLVSIDRFECFIPRKHLIFGELDRMKNGQKITGIVDSIQRSNFQSQATLSRTTPEFLVRLFENDIPEIYDGIIKIKAIAREAGSRSKIAVFSEDSSVDAVATCIGVRGKKIQNITKELGEEKIDVISWHPDVATFLINSLKNIPIVNVVADHKTKSLDVVLTSENISNAIGRRGQNVRLLSNLTGWAVHFITEDENSQKKIKEFEECVTTLTNELDLEEIVAQLLVAAGFATIDIITKSGIDNLKRIEGFNEDIAKAIHSRASDKVKTKEEEIHAEIDSKIATLSAKVDILSCEDVVRYMLLNKHSLQDIADFSLEEIRDELDANIEIDDSKLSDAIMACRKYFDMI